MPEQKTHIPRHDGDVPADYAGGKVWNLTDPWGGTTPSWIQGETYRYTPKANEPSKRALLVAHKRAYPHYDWSDEQRARSEDRAIIELARMIEERAPELLADPLGVLLRDALHPLGFELADIDAAAAAAEIRKRGPAFITAVGEG